MVDDKKLRELLQKTELQPSENLRYRIMQQIEVENAIKPSRVKSNKPIVSLTIGVLIGVYLLIMVIAVVSIVVGGVESLISVKFIFPAFIILFSGTIYLLTSLFDERRYRSRGL